MKLYLLRILFFLLLIYFGTLNSYQSFAQQSNRQKIDSIQSLESPVDIFYLESIFNQDKGEFSKNLILSLNHVDYKSDQEALWKLLIMKGLLDDSNSINLILRAMKSNDLSEDLVFYYYPDLVKIKDQKIFKYLVTSASNKNKLCFNDLSETNQACTFQILSLMLPAIQSPYNINEVGEISDVESEEELQEVLNWFLNQESFVFR